MSACGSRIFLIYDNAGLQILCCVSAATATNHKSGKVTPGVPPDLDARNTFPERWLARPVRLFGSDPRNHLADFIPLEKRGWVLCGLRRRPRQPRGHLCAPASRGARVTVPTPRGAQPRPRPVLWGARVKCVFSRFWCLGITSVGRHDIIFSISIRKP